MPAARAWPDEEQGDMGAVGRHRSLREYRAKRDFRRSPEPPGEGAKRVRGRDPIFVIQLHDATARHYDFRLEIDGVLVSWAVPRGPSTDPRARRLAMRTEDHPLQYASFEGTIPAGEYGGGAVIVWDTGTFHSPRAEPENEGEAPVSLADQLEQGHIVVWLDGQKLRGGYALIRTHIKGREKWMLIKMRDSQADARRNPVSTQRESVLSGRTVEQVAAEGTAARGGRRARAPRR